jgi:hypothetical protein
MRTFAIAALLAGALLAGCSGPNDGPDPASDSGPTFDDLDLQATSTTGIIRGVVVDDAIRPVAGAKVALQGELAREAVSTDLGTFGFEGLPAGTYFLNVGKPGYFDAQQSAEVVAGVAEPPVVKVQLAVDAANLPYVETYVYEGFVECTTSAVVLCGAPNLVTGDNITNDRFTWDQYIGDGADLVQSEMIWTSTQAVSPQLYFEMEALNGECEPDAANDDGFMGSVRGESPIMARINASLLQLNGIGSACPIYYSVFSGGPVCTEPTPIPEVGTLNPICPGATVEQRFSMYVHAFHGYLPPEDWRFSSGEPVPQPEG